MANSLKKFIAVLSASAVVASVMPIAFAEAEDEIDEAAEVVEVAEVDEIEAVAEDIELETAESSVIYEEDFSGFEAGTLVNFQPGTSPNETYIDNGFIFECGSRENGDWPTVGISAVSDATNGMCLNMFATKPNYNDSGRKPRVILTRSGKEHTFEVGIVVTLDLKFTTGVDNTLNVVDSDGKAIAINTSSDIANKWVTATVVSTADSSYILVVDKATSDVISFTPTTTTLKNVDRLTFTENQTVQAMYIGSVYVADEEYVLPDEIILAAAVNSLTIAEGQMGMEVKDGVYYVKRDVALPADPDGSTVEWSLSQSAIGDGASWTETSLASIEDGVLVLKATEDSDKYYVKATAIITVGELEAKKEFRFVILTESEEEASIKYNESFDGFPEGAIVDMSTGSNGSYKDTNGFTFTCGTRGGDYQQIGVFVAALSGTDNYIQLREQNYIGQSRQPVMNFVRTSEDNFKNAVYLDMDLNFSSADGELQIVDAGGTILSITPLSDKHLNKWLRYVISSSAGTTIAVYDGDTAISYYTDDHSLKNVAKFTTPDKIVGNISINNLVVADKRYSTPDADIVAAAKANIDITDLTAKDGVYTATADFELPSAPTGSTVTWKAVQKAKDSNDWTDSTFITVSGLNATINPTSEIGNYDVKLIATITSGTAVETKEFTIALPNPMDEITGFAGTLIPVVNTTDKDAANKVIKFDLSGSDVLKYDLALPVSSRTYKNTTAAWTSSDSDHISIAADGTATIMTSDLNTHDVTLTAVVTYKKGAITYSSEEQVFTVKMGYTEDDVKSDDETLSKYKVRFDKAYNDNFKDIPSSTTSSISLPAKGYFGSTFAWNSSVPTVITNQGVVKRDSNTKSVILAAAIVSGAVSDEKQFTVSVPGTGTGGGGGGGGGSTSSTGTVSKGAGAGTISTPTTSAVEGSGSVNGEEIVNNLLEEKAQSQDLFTDLSSARWASDAINGLAKAGVINGVTDTRFAPNDTVTRAQFAKMLMGTFGLTASTYTTSSFADVATSAWYFDAVETAYNLGIINGVEDGIFAPDALITRQDMAVMVARAAEAAGKTIPEVTGSKSFGDSYKISDYAAAAVDTLVKAGIINGISDAVFAPLDNATRAQAAKILYNFL